MRAAVRIAVGAAAAAALALVGAGGLLGSLVLDGPLFHDKVVSIPKGAGLATISRRLAEEGVVHNPYQFMIAASLKGAHRSLRAGEYEIPAGVSVFEAVEILRSGRTVVHRFTVPEGLTSAQVMQLLEQEPGLTGPVPPPPPDGSLLPETYHFSVGDTRVELVARMQTKMRETLAELWTLRMPHSPVNTPEEAVILASIVEKETSVPGERPRVAGVFANRLLVKMPLQSDPTVVYALTGGKGPLGRPLTRNDLRFESPYNTYVSEGLPPGPIANPGRASIEAVLAPEQHEFLYFVADGTGGHAFAKTLNEHNRNVAKWRAVQRDSAVPADLPSN